MIGAVAQGSQVRVLLHMGGVLVPGGNGLLEPVHCPVGFLLRELGGLVVATGESIVVEDLAQAVDRIISLPIGATSLC